MEIRRTCGGTVVSRSEARFTTWTRIALIICYENNEKENRTGKDGKLPASTDATLAEGTIITCYIDDQFRIKHLESRAVQHRQK